MSDRPFTDADLRAEAARQHHSLIEDRDPAEVWEQMGGVGIPSQEPPHGEGYLWDLLAPECFAAARDAVDGLLASAADVSRWAVELGAEGLAPDRWHVFRDDEGRAFAAVQMAFDPAVVRVAEAREALSAAIRAGLGLKPA